MLWVRLQSIFNVVGLRPAGCADSGAGLRAHRLCGPSSSELRLRGLFSVWQTGKLRSRKAVCPAGSGGGQAGSVPRLPTRSQSCRWPRLCTVGDSQRLTRPCVCACACVCIPGGEGIYDRVRTQTQGHLTSKALQNVRPLFLHCVANNIP